MENLTLRMQGEVRFMLFILLAFILVFCLELHQYRSHMKALQSARKHNARRMHDKEARNARSFLIGVPILALVLLIACGITLREYHLDRTENAPLQAQGVVTFVGRQNSRRNSRQYRMILETDTGETLTLKIHKSLVDDYAIEEGAAYEVAYYPRTMTLCTADKIE